MSCSKHNFKAGDVIRAAHLNAMDAQIEELSNRANNSGSNTCEDCLTADSLKTINGQSLVGCGDIVISGGGNGTVGPQGPQGEQGPKGEDGADGVSITSVKQTTTSSADGGTNVITVTLSNGTTSTFNVKNGSKGSTGSKGDTGAAGANGVTFTPSVDSAGNLSWTNNGGLTNPSTVNIKGPKGDAGSGGSSSSGSGAYSEVNHGTSDTTFTLTPNTFHVWEEVASLELTFGDETAGVANEYLFQFTSGSEPTSLILPDDIKWANELIIEPNMIYQVSILKGLASCLEFDNAAALIENLCTFDNYRTVTFQYPVASDVTVYVGNVIATVTIGNTSGQLSSLPEPESTIIGCSPMYDNIYNYTC